LSLDENTLSLAFENAVTPVLIPAQPGDLDSRRRASPRPKQHAYLSSPTRCSTRFISALPHQQPFHRSAAVGRMSNY
jgi:hypothetical protein